MTFDRFFHILNPSRRRRRPVRRLVEASAYPKMIWVNRDSHPTHLETIIEWAVWNNELDFAVWGGDGTLSRTVNALARHNALGRARIAIIPAGTGNDFSRNFARPDIAAWAAAFDGGRFGSRLVDVGEIETPEGRRVFLNNAGFGRARDSSRGSSNPLADIARLQPHRLQIEWGDGGSSHIETVRALLGIVFNGPYFNRGLHFDPGLSVSDGRMEAILVPPGSKLALASRFVRGRLGRALARRSDLRVRAETLVVESENPLFPQADGEPAAAEAVRRISFSIRPSALRICYPQEEPNEQAS